MIRRALGVLAAVLLLAACGGGGGSTTPATRSSGSGAVPGLTPTVERVNQRVLVLGDSNLFESGAQVEAALRGAGLDPTLRGVPSLGLKDLDDYWLPELPGLLAADPAVVVVALGTNDTTAGADVDAFGSRLDTMMQAIGDRPVVWVTHVERRPFEVTGGGHSVNQAIRTAMDRWPNLTVLDRTALLAQDPTLLRDDGLHFTDVGMTAFAAAIRDSAWAAIGAQTRLGFPSGD